MRGKRAKKLKYYIPILKKGGLWVDSIVKNVIECNSCVKKVGLMVYMYWQAGNIGRHIRVPARIFFPCRSGGPYERARGRRLPTLDVLHSDKFCFICIE